MVLKALKWGNFTLEGHDGHSRSHTECNDKSLVLTPPIYNHKHVHILVLPNKVIYHDIISHAHRHASCVYKM